MRTYYNAVLSAQMNMYIFMIYKKFNKFSIANVLACFQAIISAIR